MNPDTVRKVNSFPVRVIRGHNSVILVCSLGVGILAWHIISAAEVLPAFMLPAPGAVWQRLLKSLGDGSLLRNSLVTLSEVLSGLSIGLLAATVLGYFLARSRLLERFLAPYIVASQSIPIVAFAPLLVIWFGPGLFSKILICALIVFFPILINTIIGIRSVPDDLRDLMRSLQATRWKTIKLLEMPAALPVILGGLRVGATLSVIGAVVGEFVGADKGLGFLINQARGVYDTALVFVAVFALIAMAMILYGLVVLLELRLLSWQQSPEQRTITIEREHHES